MTLTVLKAYMQKNHVVGLNELKIHFDMDAETVRDMLDILIRKGQVRKIRDSELHCNKCAQCHNMLADELYEYIS